MTADQISDATLAVAVATFFVAFFALVVAWQTLGRGNRNASAATALGLSEGFRQAWDRYFAAESGNDQRYALADLLNLTELACGILREKTLAGVSKEIVSEYLHSVFNLLEADELLSEIAALRSHRDTFKYIVAFLATAGPQASHAKLRSALAAATHLNAAAT